MAKYRDRFITGGVEHGLSKKLAIDVFELIERFAGYGFNKAHSAAYAVIAAQTAYLKANHHVEFMAALLSSEIGNTDKIVSNVAECRRARIPVLPPDANRSRLEFSVEPQADGSAAVRFGLGAVKNAGESAVRAIVAARDNRADAAFASLEAMCEAIDWSIISRRVLESLAKCGALDCFGPRSRVLAALPAAIAAGQRNQKAIAKGQIGLFDLGDLPAPIPGGTGLPPAPELPQRDLLTWEKELLGLYMSAHPLSDVLATQPRSSGSGRLLDIEGILQRTAGDKVRLIAMVVNARRIGTKKGRTMAIVELEDLTGSIELVAFPDTFERTNELWASDAILLIEAKLDRRGESFQLICETATAELPIEGVQAPPRRTIRLRLPVSKDVWADIQVMHRLDAVFQRHEGEDRLILQLPGRDSRLLQLRCGGRHLNWSQLLEAELTEILGPGQVELYQPELEAVAS
ncbi:MAG: hypothetical protein H0V24_17025 [Chloroflexia bacterium]|nr:hypothetical protein [Chloroflexia bacterium]